MKQKGILAIPILFIVLGLLAVGTIAAVVLTKKSPTGQSNSNQTTYSVFQDPELGIRFSYLGGPTGATVTRNGDYVSVRWTASPENSGQLLQIFAKDPNETLAATITRQLLGGLDPKDCFVRPYVSQDLQNYPTGYEIAEITYPDSLITDADPFGEKSICPATYRRSNGLRYFLMDPENPERFFFFNVGQESIPGGVGEGWHTTVRVKPVMLVPTATSSGASAGWKTYTNSNFSDSVRSYTLAYPPDWGVDGTDPKHVRISPPGGNEPRETASPDMTIDFIGLPGPIAPLKIENPMLVTIGGRRSQQGIVTGIPSLFVTQETFGIGVLQMSWPVATEFEYTKELILSTIQATNLNP